MSPPQEETNQVEEGARGGQTGRKWGDWEVRDQQEKEATKERPINPGRAPGVVTEGEKGIVGQRGGYPLPQGVKGNQASPACPCYCHITSEGGGLILSESSDSAPPCNTQKPLPWTYTESIGMSQWTVEPGRGPSNPPWRLMVPQIPAAITEVRESKTPPGHPRGHRRCTDPGSVLYRAPKLASLGHW